MNYGNKLETKNLTSSIMEKTTFLTVYIITFVGCLLLTLIIIKLLQKGLRRFLEKITQDAEISYFFSKLVSLVLFLGGFSAALSNSYVTDEKANWLTLSWDSVNQVRATLESLFTTLIIVSVVFLILELINRKLAK